MTAEIILLSDRRTPTPIPGAEAISLSFNLLAGYLLLGAALCAVLAMATASDKPVR